MTSQWLLSVITPAYNEAENLPVLYRRLNSLCDELATQGGRLEWIVVDDGSCDDTPAVVVQIAETDSKVRLIRLARNCGSHAAMSAGLAHCRGDCAVIMAADLQDPPELLAEMAKRWREGFHVVWGVRQTREGVSWTIRVTSAAYYWIMRRIALAKMPPQGADFLLLDRKVIDCCNAINEKHTSLLALIQWMGFRQTSFTYVKRARHLGKSKWTLAKKMKLFVDSIVSFSYAPICAMWLVGMLFLLAGVSLPLVIAGCWLLDRSLFSFETAAIITVLLLGQGSIVCSLALLGEYLWRAYDQVRGRPRYFIEYSYPCQDGRPAVTSFEHHRPAEIQNSEPVLVSKTVTLEQPTPGV